ncbi:malectin domain-containing carbohydrate-binding protein [Aquiflexum sp. TKW24L]|uniref:LamG-like jellyroll fold domain-containing protein n=1 Tax=Aquiflexum sp. TKW24L TaxID=2942212 RepID=UPI0020BD750C|nr:LamG-like jellyroll fold domain-containing protein [Aquiflexum sp. TKW24L]MCL6259260.1 malectin domain-containing carbohydrate-binding protein [Aquiflexum sp. TKW24L]
MCTSKNLFLRTKCAALLIVLLAFSHPLLSQTISFGLDTLQFGGFTKPAKGTSLKFGPDGRLYLAQLNGQIKIYSIQKSSTNEYKVIAAETLLDIQNIPNHDDIGTLAKDGRSNRQSTGLTVVGTAANPIIYITSSDPKWGGPSGDKVLDTNSGIISRLTWTGSKWDVVDLVRGLPRSEENHSPNGLEFTVINGKPYLLVTSGGHTNAGSPSLNFAYLGEYALSAAVLSIDLNAIDALPLQTDSQSGRKFKYDIPTLDDPSRPNANGIYNPNQSGYNGIDVGDPFGGNDGLNMGMIVAGGPVQIFSSGYRNTYDLVVTESGKVFVTENGPNTNWGGLPENEGNALTVTNRYLSTEPGNNSTNPSPSGEYVSNKDHLMMITSDITNYTFGSYYGGHPNPLRANPGNPYTLGASFPFNPGGSGLFTRSLGDDADWSTLTPLYTPNEVFRTSILAPVAPGQAGFDAYASNSLPVNWPPVPKAMANPNEADFRSPDLGNPNGPQKQLVTIFPINTNGIAEYKASTFSGVLKGALIAGKSNGTIHLIMLNPDGSLKQLEANKWNLNSGNALGISSNGDTEIFPGTIWVTTFDNRIHVLTPLVSTTCILQTNPDFNPNADYDNDGFTNQDELDNGTDYCSAASKPNDFDGDFISDLNDLDDDGDGISDALDPFQLGNPTNLPIDNELFSDKTDELNRPFGYLGLGFTGLMNNGAGKPNWLNWLDVPNGGPLPNDIYGGAAGAVQLAITSGTANGSSNTQQKGFQFGANVGNETGEFLVTGRLLGLTGPQLFYDITHNGEIGIQMGDGTQSNFFKLVFTKTQITAGLEINDVQDPNPLTYSISSSDRPTSSENIDFMLKVRPVQGTVEPMIKIGNRSIISLGTKNLTGKVLEAVQQISKPLAIGIIGTSGASDVEFLATYDFFRVIGDQPYIVRTLDDISKQVGSQSTQIDLGEYFNDGGGLENLLFTVSSNSNSAIGASIVGKILTLTFPALPNSGLISIRATDLSSLFVEQTFKVDVIAAQQILFRINAGGIAVAGLNGAPNWKANEINGSYTGDGYTITNGATYSGNLLYANKHSSIPDYIDKTTFESIFKNERHNSGASVMTYSIPIPNGDYEVNLYMGNSFSGTSTVGTRVFDVKAEGTTVLSNVDLIAKFGHQKGGMEKIYVKVSDGILNIEFVKKTENPLINAIEIIDTQISAPIVITNEIQNQLNKVGETLDGNLFFTATGGVGQLFYSAVNLPPGVTIEDVNGRIYGTIATEAFANSPYQVTLTVKDSNSPVPNQESRTFYWTVSGNVFRINAGGTAVSGLNGAPSWKANDINGSYSGDGYSVTNGASYIGNLLYENKHSSIPSYIDKTTFDLIFKNERHNNNASVMTYDIPLVNGDYQVNLYMGNAFSGTSTVGTRVFDVKAEGNIALSDVDLVSNFGHQKGGMQKFQVKVTDGILNIEFVKKIQNPLVNAIEIIKIESISPLTITNEIPNQSNKIGDVLDGNLLFTATGGVGQLTYSSINLPLGVFMDVNGKIYGTIESGAYANSPFKVTLTVKDSNSPVPNQESRTFYWTVFGNITENGIIGHWKMNEGSGSKLVDSSGNGNNATIINTSSGVIWVQGKEGLALNLNGFTDRFATVPSNSSLNISNAITISAWIRTSGLASKQILSKGGPDGYELGIFETGKIEFRINRESSGTTYRLYSNQNYPTDGTTWMHVAATFDGTKSQIFINGVIDNSATYAPTTIKTNTTELQIGARSSNNRWVGDLDELKLYNRVLSDVEINTLVTVAIPIPAAPLLTAPANSAKEISITPTLTWGSSEHAITYNVQVSTSSGFSSFISNVSGIKTTSFKTPKLLNNITYYWRVAAVNEKGTSSWSLVRSFTTNSLVAYWKMDEGSGSTLVDHSGNGNNAQKSSSTNWTWVTGKSGLALLLNKSIVQYGGVPHNSTINITQQITISAWIRPADKSGRQIISKGGTNGYELLTLKSGKVEFRFNRESNGNTYSLISNKNYPSDGKTWLHVTATFNGTKSTIYFNGVQDNSKTFSSTTIKTNTAELQIGARKGTNQWSGALDEIRLYNRSLTSTEVSNLPNQFIAFRMIDDGQNPQDLIDLSTMQTTEELTNFETDDALIEKRLYPNPVEDNINIEIPSLKNEKVQVRIFDMKGVNLLDTELEMENGKLRIDFTPTDLKQGTYILFINSDKTQNIFKFIKN